MTPRSGSGVNVQSTPSSPPTRRCSSPSPVSPAMARRGEPDRRVSAPSAIPGTGRRGSSPDPFKQLEKLQEMFEEDRAADIMAAADRDAGALPIVVNGRVVPQLTTQCWEPTHAPKIRVTATASLPVGTPPGAVPVIQVTTPSPQTSPHVRRKSLDYETYSSASLYSEVGEEVYERPDSAFDGAEQVSALGRGRGAVWSLVKELSPIGLSSHGLSGGIIQASPQLMTGQSSSCLVTKLFGL